MERNGCVECWDMTVVSARHTPHPTTIPDNTVQQNAAGSFVKCVPMSRGFVPLLCIEAYYFPPPPPHIFNLYFMTELGILYEP